MLARPEKFILLPAVCIIGAVAVGMHSATTREPAFRVLATIYIWWNAWHFASQHFGVASLLGWQWGPRLVRQAVIIAPTMAVLLVPHRDIVWLVVVAAIVDLAHWTTDIGLTTWVFRRWWWLAAAMAVGLAGFLWKDVVVADPHLCGVLPACTVVWSAPLLLSLRLGLGFWHFLMSRWVWKLSDPYARAISAPLLAKGHAS